LLWSLIGQNCFYLTVYNWYRYRVFLLRLFGANVDYSAKIRRTVKLTQPWNLTIGKNTGIGNYCTIYSLGKITIGNHASISQGAHLCAGSHDYRQPSMPLLTPPIVIEDMAWIAADAFVGPNVTIHEGAILSARGVAMRDLDAWTIYQGNPAVKIKMREKITLS
jgi:putative colanic acid biosynthesis acetyltransferase WcaF